MEAKEQVPTLDVELEQALLGALIANNETIDKASSVLAASDFFDPLHQRICENVYKLHGDGSSVSPLTLQVVMRDDPGLKTLGGVNYLAALAAAAPNGANVISLAKAAKSLHDRRALATLGENITFAAKDTGEGSVKEIVEQAEQALYSIAEKNHFGSRMMGFSETIKLAILGAQKAHESGGKIVGVPTGFFDLDNLLGGLQKSDLIIIAGRPGMGKTALATNIAFHAASIGRPILFFSLEMSAEQLTGRILSEQSGVEMWRVRNGQMRSQEWEEYVLTGQKLDQVPLYIDDTGGISLPQLAARARRAKRERKIEAIVIDYLQLMSAQRRENRVVEVSEITKGLKTLAKELDIPIIALSQLSRGVDSRDDKRPVLSDLRESGSIEQDADAVMFVYRHEYYLRGREPDIADVSAYSKWQEQMERVNGKADVIVEKHRHGETRTIHLGFDGRFTRFTNLE